MIQEEKTHIPVLLNQVVQFLALPKGGVFVDGTLGLGGHAKALLEVMGPQVTYVGIDRDKEALERARKNLAKFIPRVHLVHDNYRHIDRILEDLSLREVDAILLDVGLSSYQVDAPERGFSFRQEGPLDMRMNPEDPTSAYHLVNALSEQELTRIFFEYGEERWAKRIAKKIVQKRHLFPIETTTQLADIIQEAVPFKGYTKIHPATRVFQALRIAVNGELEALKSALEKCVHVLKAGGRIGVISFHSLEDRLVKQTFRQLAKTGLLKILTKKPVRPEEKEAAENPRAPAGR